MAKTDAKTVELTQRVCRWCGAKYVYPKWGKRPGCQRCQPQLWDNERN